MVKLIICIPELSAKASKAAEKSSFTYNNETQVVSLGEASGCLNLFELMKNVDANDAKEPVKVNDPDNDNLIIFWSSGTTGKKTFFSYSFYFYDFSSCNDFMIFTLIIYYIINWKQVNQKVFVGLIKVCGIGTNLLQQIPSQALY